MLFTLKRLQILCRSVCTYQHLPSNEGEALARDAAAVLCLSIYSALGHLLLLSKPALPHSAVSALKLPPPASFPYISVSFHHIPPCIPCSQSCPSVLCFLCLDSPSCSLLCMHYSSSLAVLCKTVLLTHSPLPSFPPYSSALELLTFSWICMPCLFQLACRLGQQRCFICSDKLPHKVTVLHEKNSHPNGIATWWPRYAREKKAEENKGRCWYIKIWKKDTRLKGFLIKCFATIRFLRSSLDSQSLLL